MISTVWGRDALYHVTDFTWKIIGARDMTDKELIEFSRWEETR